MGNSLCFSLFWGVVVFVSVFVFLFLFLCFFLFLCLCFFYCVVLMPFLIQIFVFIYRECSEDDEAVEAMAEIDKFEDSLIQKEIVKSEWKLTF